MNSAPGPRKKIHITIRKEKNTTSTVLNNLLPAGKLIFRETKYSSSGNRARTKKNFWSKSRLSFHPPLKENIADIIFKD